MNRARFKEDAVNAMIDHTFEKKYGAGLRALGVVLSVARGAVFWGTWALAAFCFYVTWNAFGWWSAPVAIVLWLIAEPFMRRSELK